MMLSKKSKTSMIMDDGDSSVLFRKGDLVSFTLKDGNHNRGMLYEVRKDGFAILREAFPGGPVCPCGLFCYDWIEHIDKEA